MTDFCSPGAGDSRSFPGLTAKLTLEDNLVVTYKRTSLGTGQER